MKGLGGYLLYRVLSAAFGLLPERAMRRAGESMGRLASYVAPNRMKLAQRHLRRVLGETGDVEDQARAMFASYGRYWAEVFWVRPRRKQFIRDHAEVVGLEHIEAAKQAGRGIVLALPHVGNWEAAGAKARELDVPVLAVAEALPNRRILEWFVDLRRRMDIDVVHTQSGKRVMGELLKRVQQGGTVALLADRDLSGRGIEVEFFGERTTVPAGPVSLAERTGATLLPVGCYFKPGRGHLFVVHPPVVFQPGNSREATLAAGAQHLASILERIIREAPEQWHLFQPNWPSDREGRAA